MFYLQDSRTGKQQSLETKDRNAALRLLEIKRQTVAEPGFNQFILKTCLSTQDPFLAKRTWQCAGKIPGHLPVVELGHHPHLPSFKVLSISVTWRPTLPS